VRLARWCVRSLFAWPFLFGCGGDSGDSGNAAVTRVTSVYHGAIVPAPVSTTVMIPADSIAYSAEPSGHVIIEWSKRINSSDFLSVRKVITDHNLFESADVFPASGQDLCYGSFGITIRIKKGGNAPSFEFSGPVMCRPEQWPEGVRERVDLLDTLLAKYQL
jgi:hypothetical protein